MHTLAETMALCVQLHRVKDDGVCKMSSHRHCQQHLIARGLPTGMLSTFWQMDGMAREHPSGVKGWLIWYTLTINLFRDPFQLTAKEKTGISRFVLGTYVDAWFVAPLASSAPSNDLVLLKKLVAYKYSDISKADTVSILNGHETPQHVSHLKCITYVHAVYNKSKHVVCVRVSIAHLPRT